MGSRILLFLVLTLKPEEAGPTLCYQCLEVYNPLECDRVTECSSQENCFLGEYPSTSGQRTFDMNCKYKNECSSGRKNGSEEPAYLCAECCDTQGCNIIGKACKAHTGSSVNISEYQACFKCIKLDSPEKCDQVTFCAQDETCAVTTQTSLGQVLYTGSCTSDTKCHNLSTTPINYVAGRPFINRCCKGNFCNGFFSTFIECGPPPPITRTDSKFATTNYGSTVEYTCSTGYAYISGDKMAKCQLDGKWSQSNVHCEIDCGDPFNVTGAQVTFSTTYRGSVATYHCYTGRVYLRGTNTSTCDASGNWNMATIDCAVDCGQPPSVTGARPIYKTTYIASSANYFCVPPYLYAGGRNNTVCETGGRWKPLDLKCEADCGRAHYVNKTTCNYTSTKVGSKVIYNCKDGYTFAGGVLESTCLSTGVWTHVTILCGVDCGLPPSVPNAFVDTQETSHAHYRCNSGFSYSSGNITSTCQTNGSWSPINLLCSRDGSRQSVG